MHEEEVTLLRKDYFGKTMRISEYYDLEGAQPTLDFVDVDILGDTPVFVDPRALRLLHSAWAYECVALIQNFFQTVINAIQRGQDSKAKRLLRMLREPNETHLGLSKGRARGRALGHESASDVWIALSRSQAVQTGLLEDLEDTILLVEGIDVDIVSDIATNIIRRPLIMYTQEMAKQYGIDLDNDVDSGPLWDPGGRQWYSEFTALPVTKWGKLLLVPKAIVRRKMEYDADEYYRHYILEYLREVELDANTELVRLLKNGSRRVNKKDLERKYGRGKMMMLRETLKEPGLIEAYRRDKNTSFSRPPLDHQDLAETEGSEPPNWQQLLDSVREVSAGREGAAEYEKAIEALLSALFYPSLAHPQKQTRLHEGRKIVDITYTNLATQGFFYWLSANYSSPMVMVECKNYFSEPGNPELDQLSGRFSPSRGRFGILVCRKLENRDLFLARCRDTVNDDRGYIIPIDDGDLADLVAERAGSVTLPEYSILRERFKRIIF